MNILFFDVETTGLPNMRGSFKDTTQPDVVQLAALLVDGETVEEKAHINLIIDPACSIPLGASDIHGITTEIAKNYGVTPEDAALVFEALCNKAEMFVAHNLSFDAFMLDVLFYRALGVKASNHKPGAERFCTMTAAAPIVDLPATDRMVSAGIGGPKAPKLAEAYKFFMGADLVGAHDAMVDVRACRDIYFAIEARQKK